MNFCVAISLLKMKENTQHFWHFMLCYFKKGKNETHTKKICAACGESAVTDRKSKKWFAKFHATDASPEDTPW